MNFNVTLIDPQHYKFGYFLTDTCRTFAAGLRSLGHRCDLTVNNIDVEATNIIVGSHLLTADEINQLVASTARYIVFQSEWLFADPATGAVHSGFSGERFVAQFGDLFKRSVAVWDCLEGNLPLLAKMGLDPAQIKLYFPGFHEDLVDVCHRPIADKDVGVLFFGSPTEHRNAVLNKVGRRAVVRTLFDAPSAFRNDLIARARINLVLHSGPSYSYLPPQRAGYLLNNRCCVVAEALTTPGPLDDLVLQVPRQAIAERCAELLATEEPERLAEDSFERYRERPVTRILAQLLD